jgi:hypothetical protein
MREGEWHPYLLDGRRLDVRESPGGRQARMDDREVDDRHLDRALSKLSNVPTRVAVRLAPAVPRCEPGSDISR